MEKLSRRDLLRQGDQVAELVSVLRAVIEGTATREALVALTRRMWPHNAQGTPFPQHGVATTVFDSVWNALERQDDEFVVRDSDLALYVRWLIEGEAPAPRRPLAKCRLTSPQIASRVGVQTVRYFVDGIGLQESVSFASLATGRRFVATSSCWTGDPSQAFIESDEPDKDGALLLDLFDALAIDFDDLIDTIDASQVAWDLWRQDDNGIRAKISSFTGLAKAQRSLASFEQLGHKQTYWIEERAT